MRYDEIGNSEEMIEYMIECTLATVEKYIFPKTINKSEFSRQCEIAQKGIDFLRFNFSGKYVFTGRAKEFVNTEKAFDYYSRKREEYQKGVK